MHKYITVLFSVIVIHFNSFAQADTAVTYKYWLYVCESTKHEKFYIRSQYESKNESEIKIWVKTVTPLITVKNKKYKNSFCLQLYVFDCENNTAKGIRSITYSTDGDILKTNDYEEIDFIEIIPETVMELVSQYTCERFNQ